MNPKIDNKKKCSTELNKNNQINTKNENKFKFIEKHIELE